MATIVNSVILSEDTQKDSRIWVHELHTDLVNVTHERMYLAISTDNLNTNLSAYAVRLGNDLVNNEINTNLNQVLTFGSNAVVTTSYCTFDQVVAAARASFLTSTSIQSVLLGDWFNTLSFIQLQSAFGFPNVASYNAFKALWFTPNANLASSVRVATGA